MIVNDIQTITAIEKDGLNIRTFNIKCKILKPSPNFDLQDAVKQAVRQYLHTPDGRRTYIQNMKCFNWADFAVHVPNKINKLHGFEIIESALNDIIVDWDEHLADDTDIQEFWGDKLNKD